MAYDITVIDGGLTTVLEDKVCSLTNDPLWTARLLKTNPSYIIEAHKSYLLSGSDIITTASYQASICGFQKHLDLTRDQSIDLIKQSVLLAKEAKEQYLKNSTELRDKEIKIAGSVGPYGAYLANGSEYTGIYCDTLTHEDLFDWHYPRIHSLVEAGVDLLAFETIPGAKEAEVLLKILHNFPEVKAWLSFSCQSLHETAHNEAIGLVAKNCVQRAPAGQLVAVGVNCCKPSYVYNLLKDISESIVNFPLIAYPNSGETWKNTEGWINSKEPFHSYLDSWIEFPIKFIGGCCRTGPNDIKTIVEHLKNIKI